MADCSPAFLVPGPAGPAGTNGTNGTNGVNAFTTLTATFVMPAEAGVVTATVADSTWMANNQIVYVDFAGYMNVQSKPSSTSVILRNEEATATSRYAGNAPAGTVIPVGAAVTPAGLQGPNGIDGASGAPTNATYITQIPNGTLTSEQALSALATGILRSTTGTGVISIATDGTHYLSPATGVEIADIGVTVQAFDSFLLSIAALGTAADRMIYTTAINTAAEAVITAFARSLVDDADAIAARTTLGVNRTLQDYLLYRHQLAAGTSAGSFDPAAAWQLITLNTEVADTGGHGTLAASVVTLAQGTYRARWRVCGYLVDTFQSRLFNVTTAGVIAYGANARAGAADTTMGYSDGETRFSVAAATENIRLEGQCQTLNAASGMGISNAFGGTQVYAMLELNREANV